MCLYLNVKNNDLEKIKIINMTKIQKISTLYNFLIIKIHYYLLVECFKKTLLFFVKIDSNIEIGDTSDNNNNNFTE